MTLNSLFISYRRSDSEKIAKRIYEWLSLYFDEESIFIDEQSIQSGARFPDVIMRTLKKSSVVLVVVGKSWLTVKDDYGKRRLDNQEDWVRIEVREALLREDILLIPLLVDGAVMPSEAELPNELKELSNRHGHEVRRERRGFKSDIVDLIEIIEQRFEEEPRLSQEIAYSQKSHLAIVSASPTAHEEPLILIDPEIAVQWDFSPEDINVYEGIKLSAMDETRIKLCQDTWPKVKFCIPSDLLLPELKFIDYAHDGIPGSLIQQSLAQPLAFAGEHITPLLPISSALLAYLTPEDIVERVEIRVAGDSSNAEWVEFTLDLPLTGTQSELTEARNYRLTRTYKLKEENSISAIPVLEIWPRLTVSRWKAYYAFFFDLGAANQTFYARFPGNAETETFDDDQGGKYSLTRMEDFPSFVECLDATNQVIGLILMQKPPEIFPDEDWEVGVDFGSNFTNVHVRRNSGEATPLHFDETLLLKVTDSALDTRFPALFNYFVPDRFLPVETPLPLSNVLTTRGHDGSKGIGSRAILDGRIYNPSVRDFDPQEEWIETSLQQGKSDAGKLFIQHLILHISANAVKQGAKDIKWMLSYPSTFSKDERNQYASTWVNLLKSSSVSTGIEHQCSADIEKGSFESENQSIAKYFINKGKADWLYATCIYVDRDISHISIWQHRALLYQTSIQFAGDDWLANLLELKPSFVPKYFNREPAEWMGLRGDDFHSKLQVLLRWESKTWLRSKAQFINENDVEGLVRIMTLGISGLYYYIGMLLRMLRNKGVNTLDHIAPIYLCGGESRLLHWIDVIGEFTERSEVNLFLSRIMSKASGLEDEREGKHIGTQLSARPQDEISCGLVLNDIQLRESYFDRDVPISGEAFVFNSTYHDWERPINVINDVESLSIPHLSNLNTFLYEFHRTLRELQIEGIRPFPEYKLSTEFSDNAEIWLGTHLELNKILQDIKAKGESTRLQMPPPFILGLKALLGYLAQQWAKEE